jgi:hypothetical protein
MDGQWLADEAICRDWCGQNLMRDFFGDDGSGLVMHGQPTFHINTTFHFHHGLHLQG